MCRSCDRVQKSSADGRGREEYCIEKTSKYGGEEASKRRRDSGLEAWEIRGAFE